MLYKGLFLWRVSKVLCTINSTPEKPLMHRQPTTSTMILPYPVPAMMQCFNCVCISVHSAAVSPLHFQLLVLC